jgi:hypothetical protein
MEKEFKDIGMKMPYSVPDGFFDTITEMTLAKARKRERGDRRRHLLFQGLAAAAVLTGLTLTGIWLLNSDERVASPAIAVAPIEIQVPEGITKPVSGSSYLNQVPPALENTVIRESEGSLDSGNREESLDELLASIPDEELLKWAVMIDNDPFSEETENNIPNENK